LRFTIRFPSIRYGAARVTCFINGPLQRDFQTPHAGLQLLRGLHDYNVNVRPSVYGAILMLAACSPTPRQQNSATDQKKPSSLSTIHAGDFLASRDNCGLVHYVRQVYPKQAKMARVQGVVKVAYVITKTGEVRDLHVVSGDPVLVPAAIAAVTQWRFATCRVPGMSEPVEIRTQSDISFTLNQ
jgi:TonB family protein